MRERESGRARKNQGEWGEIGKKTLLEKLAEMGSICAAPGGLAASSTRALGNGHLGAAAGEPVPIKLGSTAAETPLLFSPLPHLRLYAPYRVVPHGHP